MSRLLNIFLLLFTVPVFAATVNNPATTNRADSSASAGVLPVWDSVAGQWTFSTTNFLSQFATSNMLWVSKGGEDGAGRRGVFSPYQTVAAAANAAQPGDTVGVFPGVYYNASNLLARGVNWECLGAPGSCVLTFTNTTNNGPGWGIFDDRFRGPTTNYINGFSFIWGNSPGVTNSDFNVFSGWPTNIKGCIVITNQATHVMVNGHRIDTIQFGNGAESGCIYQRDGRNCFFKFDELYDLGYTTNNWVLHGTNGLDGSPIYEYPQGQGLYWLDGEMFCDIDRIYMVVYAFWAEQVNSNSTNSIWITGDEHHGRYYLSSGTGAPNWRGWMDIGTMMCETNADTASQTIVAGSGGRWYWWIQNLHAVFDANLPGDACISFTGDATHWMDIGTVTHAGSSGAFVGSWLKQQVTSASTVRARIHNFVQAGTTPSFAGIVLDGGTTMLLGGHASVSNGPALTYSSGSGHISGMTLQSTSTNAVRVTTSGLQLEGVALVTPSTQFSIGSDNSARTVKSYGHSVATRDTTNQVTIQVGLLTNDPNVQ